MWPFKKQVVSEEVKDLAKDIEGNYTNWQMLENYKLTNTTNGTVINYTGEAWGIQFDTTIFKSFNMSERKHLKISIDKCMTKNAISK